MEQGSKEWFAARVGRVTASRAGAILGYSPFMSRADVMREMVLEYHGLLERKEDSAPLAYGKMMEGIAKGALEMSLGEKIDDVGFVPIADWIGASPDGLFGKDYVIEIKCPYGQRNADVPEFKRIAELPHYYAQVQLQMLAAGRFKCYFYQYAPGGDDLEMVEFDPDFVDEIMPQLHAFHGEYLEEIRPENLWKYSSGGEFVREYKAAKANLELAQARMDAAKDALIDATGGKGGKIGDINVTLVTRKGAIAYAKAVKDLLPGADLSAYEGKESSSWRISGG